MTRRHRRLKSLPHLLAGRGDLQGEGAGVVLRLLHHYIEGLRHPEVDLELVRVDSVAGSAQLILVLLHHPLLVTDFC